jgi:hypothetical protein
MSRRRAAFSQADVARAQRAAEQVAPGRMVVEITPGGVTRSRPSIGLPPVEPETENEKVNQDEGIDL